MPQYSLGIDIGGTFTDLVFMSAEGKVRREKVLSTPEDYSQGIANGLAGAMSGGGMTIRPCASRSILAHVSR